MLNVVSSPLLTIKRYFGEYGEETARSSNFTMDRPTKLCEKPGILTKTSYLVLILVAGKPCPPGFMILPYSLSTSPRAPNSPGRLIGLDCGPRLLCTVNWNDGNVESIIAR